MNAVDMRVFDNSCRDRFASIQNFLDSDCWRLFEIVDKPRCIRLRVQVNQ
jgi:hypothetical protein